MPDQEPTAVVYAIDANDRIIEVDNAWVEFAEQNEAGERLRPDSVIGTLLWDHVRQPALQDLYKRLVSAVRSKQTKAEFRFRCDSPNFRRFMRMTIQPGGDGSVVFVSRTERVERVERRREDLRTVAAFSGQTSIVQCSVCNRYRSGVSWHEAEEFVHSAQPMDSERPMTQIWSVCEECIATLRR